MSLQERVFCRSRPWAWFARRVVLPWALQGVTPAGAVLEIGAGSGAMAAEILRRFPSVHLTATDYDERMVAAARKALAPFGDRATVQRADAAALGFVDSEFDLMVSFIMLHHVGAWERAIGEALRVLRPGGALVGYDLVASPITRGFHRLGRGHGERLVDARELRQTFVALGADARVRTGAGLLVRFVATKRS